MTAKCRQTFLKDKRQVLNLYMLATRYNMLPSEVLKKCDVADYNFNLHVTRVGIKQDEKNMEDAKLKAKAEANARKRS